MTLITKNNLLRFDAAIWIIFGLLWIFFPGCLLSMNTANMKYDSVHIHMTRAFGLFIIYTGIISYCVSSKEIHEWHKYYDKYKNISYPKPINSYEKAREEIKEIYKNGLYSS